MELCYPNRSLFNGKEIQVTARIGLLDYGARMYDPEMARWMSLDPKAESRIDISPYAFCSNDPVCRIDPDGRLDDWYKDHITGEYKWTDATSQNELNSMKVNGTYLGEALMIFEGSYDERLGTDGKIGTENSVSALLTVYGINGEDDIKTYEAITVSSDPKIYSMIANGEYKARQRQMSTSPYAKGSLTYLVTLPDDTTKLPVEGGINKINGKNYMEGIFFHRTNWNGNATHSSQGCLIIDAKHWKNGNIENQLGHSQNIYINLQRK